VNKILGLFLVFILISNCSLDKKSSLWTESKKIETVNDLVINELFKNEEALNKEFNLNVKIQLKSNPTKNSFVNNLNNNNGRVSYNGSLKNISRFKFSTIDNFDQIEPEILFYGDNIIFFENKGSIFNFDKFSKLIWKKNFYKKFEKKAKPELSLANDKKTLIVADNLAKYYAMNIKTGELIWTKTNVAPFNSQIKIYDDKFFVTDFDNVLRCYSIKDGSELWNVKTDTAFIKSKKKLSLVILNGNIYFNNSIGDISAVDIKTGNLIWQTPTQSSLIYENSFLLQTSDLIADDDTILLSNNRNEFFSFSANTGALNWQQKINSNIRPTLIENLIFTVTIEGFLVVIDNKTGNIIRITNVFDKIKKNKRSKIKPVGFIVGTKNIYLTTDNGLLIIIDISSGRSSSILKVDNGKISRPFILNENLFIIKDNSIIKLN
jgi:outer membrane protein assembly factor BamB